MFELMQEHRVGEAATRWRPLDLEQGTGAMLAMAGKEQHPVLTRNLVRFLYRMKEPS